MSRLVVTKDRLQYTMSGGGLEVEARLSGKMVRAFGVLLGTGEQFLLLVSLRHRDLNEQTRHRLARQKLKRTEPLVEHP